MQKHKLEGITLEELRHRRRDNPENKCIAKEILKEDHSCPILRRGVFSVPLPQEINTNLFYFPFTDLKKLGVKMLRPYRRRHPDRMAPWVEQMLTLHKQLHEVGTPHENTALLRRIEATDS